jgi:hypothetical protein
MHAPSRSRYQMSTPSPPCATITQPAASAGVKRGVSHVDLPSTPEKGVKRIKTTHDYSMGVKRKAAEMDPPSTPGRDAKRIRVTYNPWALNALALMMRAQVSGAQV